MGETYFTHLRFALLTGIKLVNGGLACMIHGILPFLFETTGSDTAKKMIADIARRQQQIEE